MRIRAAPPGVPFPAEVGKDVVLVLQISAEARLFLDGAIDLRIERAIDEHGRERTGRPVWTDPPDDRDDWPRGFRPPGHRLRTASTGRSRFDSNGTTLRRNGSASWRA